MKKLVASLTLIAALGWSAAIAQTQITPGGIAMQPAATALAHEVHFFHNGILLPIITAISLFVLGLLLWVLVRYNAKANPTPRKFSHNTLIEVIWTAVPIMILLVIALPSFDLLYKEDVLPDGKQTVSRGDGSTVEYYFYNDFPEKRVVARPQHLQVMLDDGAEVRTLAHRDDYTVTGWGEPEIMVSLTQAPAPGDRVIIRGGRSQENASDCPMAKRYFDMCEKNVALAPTMTLKVNGYQWGWTYAYPDFGDFEFVSNMVAEDLTKPGSRLEVDNRVVVPVGETVRVTMTARDVIHSWAVPAFAIKIDAVPGRINETWFNAETEGVYYGQCSEICGVKHSFMPIAVEVVSRAAFEAWVDEQREFAGLDPMFTTDAVRLADAASVQE